jgi:hypothetical protein
MLFNILDMNYTNFCGGLAIVSEDNNQTEAHVKQRVIDERLGDEMMGNGPRKDLSTLYLNLMKRQFKSAGSDFMKLTDRALILIVILPSPFQKLVAFELVRDRLVSLTSASACRSRLPPSSWMLFF